MRWLHWLKDRRPGRPSSAARRRRARPCVEPLEARTVLTVPDAATPFVDRAYEDLLHHPADTAALEYWGEVLTDGNTYSQVALAIQQSGEYRALVVQDIFNHYLQRAATRGEVDF